MSLFQRCTQFDRITPLFLPTALLHTYVHMYIHVLRYGDAVRELDYGVGVILNELKTLGVEKDTLVIFSSDNGGATYAKESGELFTHTHT